MFLCFTQAGPELSCQSGRALNSFVSTEPGSSEPPWGPLKGHGLNHRKPKPAPILHLNRTDRPLIRDDGQIKTLRTKDGSTSVCYSTCLVPNPAAVSQHFFYLSPPLQLEQIDVLFASEADDKVKEDCCPGKPFSVFRSEVQIWGFFTACWMFSVPSPCHKWAYTAKHTHSYDLT